MRIFQHCIRAYRMPTTRSASRAAAATLVTPPEMADPLLLKNDLKTAFKTKRKASESAAAKEKSKKNRVIEPELSTAMMMPSNCPVLPAVAEDQPSLVPAVLSFSFEEAKMHLIQADRRFEDLFDKMKCKPFEHLEQVHPFRALTSSILGQQISWKAARSINYKFIRLYDKSLSETPSSDDFATTKSPTSFFPTPHQVASTDIATLRMAGLSERKAQYVQDLANRFADGRLSTEKLLAANDEELARMLLEVRGIGQWTVDMFAIFSLRRPDILPVGDLGVQRGLFCWTLALHSKDHTYCLEPEKVQGTPDDDVKGQSRSSESSERATAVQSSPDLSSVPPSGAMMTPISETLDIGNTLALSLAATKDVLLDAHFEPPQLPDTLTVSILKSRWDKKVKGAKLTPKEMEQLTESWRPYRSLGVYYMWSLSAEEFEKDGKKEEGMKFFAAPLLP